MAVGWGAYQQHFNPSHAHYWWPSRDDGKADNNEGIDNRQPQDVNGSLVRERQSQKVRVEENEKSKKVYILGSGNLGAWVAHSLAGIPSPPPITLLLKRRQLKYYVDRDSSIEVTTRGIIETRRGFDVELLLPPSQTYRVPDEISPSLDTDLSKHVGSNDKFGASDWPSKSSSEPGKEGIYQATAAKQVSPDNGNSIAEKDSFFHQHGDGPSLDAGGSGSGFNTREEEALGNVCIQSGEEKRRPQIQNEEGLFDIEAEGGAKESDDVILNLIVSVKAPQTVRAIQALSHRLTRDSTILFLQNGMGIIDEVNEKLFPDEQYRPTYMIGIVSHGLYSTRNFSVVHSGEGTIALGIMPQMPMTERQQPEPLTLLAASARYLLRTMTRTPVFVAVGFPPTDLLQQQLDKLAVNCIINPLTAINDCKNGALLSNFHFTRVMRLLLAEISLVIKNLPELKNIPNVKMRFDTVRLENLVVSIANSTAGNNSSMLQDLRLGKQTEIDYINGYIVKRGEEMGVHCVMNYMLLHMIKGRRKISQEQHESLPFMGVSGDK